MAERELAAALEAADLRSVASILRSSPSAARGTLSRDGATGLHLAARRDLADAARLLLEHDADAGLPDLHGQIALHVAARHSALSTLNVLLRHDPRTVRARDRDGATVLHVLAAASSPAASASAVLRAARHPAHLVEARDANGRSALHLAAQAGNDELVDMLLKELEADRQAPAPDHFGRTPLHLAASSTASASAITRCMRLLVEHGVDRRALDHKGRSVLHYAARVGSDTALKLVLRSASLDDLDARDVDDHTPLSFALAAASAPCLTLLLQSGADPRRTRRSSDSFGVLHYAAQTGDLEILALLVEPRPDHHKAWFHSRKHLDRLTAEDESGLTALHLAAMHGHTEACALLIQRGADLNFAGPGGSTPVQLAELHGHVATALTIKATGTSAVSEARRPSATGGPRRRATSSSRPADAPNVDAQALLTSPPPMVGSSQPIHLDALRPDDGSHLYRDRYRLERPGLAVRRHFSLVAYAEDTVSFKRVMLKFSDEEETHQWELNVLGEVSGTHVASLVTNFEDRTTSPTAPFCIVLEGGDEVLADYMVRRLTDVSFLEKLHAASSLCDCVLYLHESRILHGNLRPDSFMRTADGKWKLRDLDGSCSMGELLYLDSFEEDPYTASYFPPEFAAYLAREAGWMQQRKDKRSRRTRSRSRSRSRSRRGDSNSDGNSTSDDSDDSDDSDAGFDADVSHDVWSLAACVFEIFVGEPLIPHADRSFKEIVLRAALHGERHPEEVIADRLRCIADQGLRSMLTLFLKLDPRDRAPIRTMVQWFERQQGRALAALPSHQQHNKRRSTGPSPGSTPSRERRVPRREDLENPASPASPPQKSRSSASEPRREQQTPSQLRSLSQHPESHAARVAEATKRAAFSGDADQVHASRAWISGPRRRVNSPRGPDLVAGLGFDVYVDSARFLPDNVTVSKVTVTLYTKERKMVGQPESRVAELDSDIFNPVYGLYLEARAEAYDPSTVLVVKISTFEKHSGAMQIVGLAVHPVFYQSKSDGGRMHLLSGAFQVPLRKGLPPASGDLTPESTQGISRLRCATVLLRVVPAPSDGKGSLLSRTTISPKDWRRYGLDVAVPDYSSGVYDSTLCVPTTNERALYASRVKRPKYAVEEVAQALWYKEKHSHPFTNLSDVEIRDWLDSVLTKPAMKNERLLDYTYFAHYDPSHGLKVSVDRAKNLPKGNIYKALASLLPPGYLYRDPPSRYELQLSSQLDYQSPHRSPVWQGEYFSFHPPSVGGGHLLIVDVRGIKTKGSSLQASEVGWAAIPVGTSSGYVRTGRYQVPLFEGPVDIEFLDELGAGGVGGSTHSASDVLHRLAEEAALRTGRVRWLEGASVFVRLVDARLVDDYKSPITEAEVYSPTLSSLLPRGKEAKYLRQCHSKPSKTMVPLTITPARFDQELRHFFVLKVLPKERPLGYEAFDGLSDIGSNPNSPARRGNGAAGADGGEPGADDESAGGRSRAHSPAPSHQPPQSEVHRDLGTAWLMHRQVLPPRGDPARSPLGRSVETLPMGFSLAVDGARFLPKSCMLARLTIHVTAGGKMLRPPVAAIAEPSSPRCFPLFNARLDLQIGEEPCLVSDVEGADILPTAVVVIKVECLDEHASGPRTIGFAALNVFVDKYTFEAAEPSSLFRVNEGAFQLPLFYDIPHPEEITSVAEVASAALASSRRVPCASLLVRLGAVRSLNPSVARRPAYADRVYDSTRCVPSTVEQPLMEMRVHEETIGSQSGLRAIGPLWDRREPIESVSRSALEDWIADKLAHGRGEEQLVDPTYFAPYDPEHGLMLAVDEAINLPKGSIAKAIFSLSPPATLYREGDGAGVHFTTRHDFKSPQRCPVWRDPFVLMAPATVKRRLCAVVDVRGLVPTGRGEFEMTKIGWTLLPVIMIGDHVRTGRFRVPLFQGAVNTKLLDEALTKSALHVLRDGAKPLEGASVVIRVADQRWEYLTPRTLPADTTLLRELVSDDEWKRHQARASSKTLHSMVPGAGITDMFREEDTLKEEERDFEQAMNGFFSGVTRRKRQ